MNLACTTTVVIQPSNNNTTYNKYLSPSGYSICVLCGEDVKTKYAKTVDIINHLWVGPFEQRKKMKACLQLEEFFGICFDSQKDFQIVCKNCYRSMCKALKKENKTGKLKVACSLKQRYLLLKATSHSTIFDIPMRPLREDQRHRHRFTR